MENKKLIVIFSLIIGVLVLIDILLITYICLDVRYKREVQQMARRPVRLAKPKITIPIAHKFSLFLINLLITRNCFKIILKPLSFATLNISKIAYVNRSQELIIRM